jgi:hypothetical protein
MNNEIDYTPVPLMDVEANKVTPLTEVEITLMRKATKWVYVLCFIQLLVAIGNLLCGGIIAMAISALFISIGIAGVRKQRVRLLTVHFVYSLVLYILSLIAVVLVILYCDGCKWWIYVIGFFTILFQAIGMRHARILITLLRKKEGGQACVFSCKSKCNSEKIEQQSIPIETVTSPVIQQTNLPIQASAPFANGLNFQMMPIPAHQLASMQMQQQRFPQYFPMQPVQYPMMNQPVSIAPYNFQPQQGQSLGLFPVVYKQV